MALLGGVFAVVFIEDHDMHAKELFRLAAVIIRLVVRQDRVYQFEQ